MKISVVCHHREFNIETEMENYTKFSILVFCLMIASTIYPSESVLEKVFDDLENGIPEHVSVTLLESRSSTGRVKREAGGCLDDVMTFTFSVDGESLVLELSENDDMNVNKVIYVEEGGRIKPKSFTSFLETKSFHDVENNAAIGVTSRPLVSGGCEYQLEGTFLIRQGSFVIYPGQRPSSNDSVPHVVRRMNTAVEFGPDGTLPESGVKYTRTTDDAGGQRQRFRRAVNTYNVEVFIVTDSLVYDFWYNRTDISDPGLRSTEAINSIRQYYAFLLNEMDLRFRNIVEEDIGFRIKYAGLYISKEAGTSPWTTGIATPDPDNPQQPFVKASTALALFKTWRQNNFTSPVGDHTMLFTKGNLEGSDSSGLESAGVACTEDAVSINQDLFTFLTVTLATRALAYSLGARHDGDSNDCDPDDNYIMTSSVKVSRSDSTRNLWFFSNCSVDYFRAYTSALSSNCLLTDDSGADQSEISDILAVLPGQFYSIDEQCSLSRGNGSSMCRPLYTSPDLYESLCRVTYCSTPGVGNACNGIIPARGTTCGDKKWCIEGKCVCDENAPARSASCPHGDHPDLVARYSCADMASFPGLCTYEFYYAACCGFCEAYNETGPPGCEYGDRNPSCSAANCPSYTSAVVNTVCCQSCAAFTTPRPTTSAPVTPPGPVSTTDGAGTCETAATTTVPETTTITSPGMTTIERETMTTTVAETTTTTAENDACTIGQLSSYAHGTINPTVPCQVCDVTKSTNSWTDILIPLRSGRSATCEQVCDFITNQLLSILSVACNYARFLTKQNFADFCFVKNFDDLPDGFCPGNQVKLERWESLCGYTRAVDAAKDRQVCP